MRLLLMLVLLTLLSFSASADAAVQVNLADGGIISAQRVWRSQGTVFVLVNRDTLLEFAPYEVKLKKAHARKSRHAKNKR